MNNWNKKFFVCYVNENIVEELTCLATWKDGNARYLVGLVTHHHATSNEERFRCFVYEKTSSMSKFMCNLHHFHKQLFSFSKLLTD